MVRLVYMVHAMQPVELSLCAHLPQGLSCNFHVQTLNSPMVHSAPSGACLCTGKEVTCRQVSQGEFLEVEGKTGEVERLRYLT